MLLSERAWDGVKAVVTQHPGAVSVISLGTHVVCDDFPSPMLLMEVGMTEVHMHVHFCVMFVVCLC